jgi:VIT1/CCC1 family predicted Fe2+/Mn2+ transporter
LSFPVPFKHRFILTGNGKEFPLMEKVWIDENEPLIMLPVREEVSVQTAGRSGVSTKQAEEATMTYAVTEDERSRRFLLQVVQPGLAGLMFLVGIAAALGAGISMAFSEALSDDGTLTGRGSPIVRGGIIGAMTFLGGSLHTLPFLIPNLHLALLAAYIVVAVELVAIAAIRNRFFSTSWWLSVLQVVGGGALVFGAAWIFGNA